MTEAEAKKWIWNFYSLDQSTQRVLLLDLIVTAPTVPALPEPAPLPAGTTTSLTDLGEQFGDMASKA